MSVDAGLVGADDCGDWALRTIGSKMTASTMPKKPKTICMTVPPRLVFPTAVQGRSHTCTVPAGKAFAGHPAGSAAFPACRASQAIFDFPRFSKLPEISELSVLSVLSVDLQHFPRFCAFRAFSGPTRFVVGAFHEP
jgi:hypothetical protein